LVDEKRAVGKEIPNPTPRLAFDTCLDIQLVQQFVVRDTIKSFHNIKKDNRQTFPLTHPVLDVVLELVNVVEGGQRGAEAGLAVVKEFGGFEEGGDALFHTALKSPNYNTGDGDDAIGGWVRARAFLV
jgi:hypothetical protein